VQVFKWLWIRVRQQTSPLSTHSLSVPNLDYVAGAFSVPRHDYVGPFGHEELRMLSSHPDTSVLWLEKQRNAIMAQKTKKTNAEICQTYDIFDLDVVIIGMPHILLTN